MWRARNRPMRAEDSEERLESCGAQALGTVHEQHIGTRKNEAVP